MPRQKINYRFALAFLLVLVVFNFFPLLLLADDSAGGLVTCGVNAGPNDCNWQKLVEMFKRVTNFIFLDLMIPLAVIAIVWAGIQILIHRDNPEQLNKAKVTLKNVGIGIFFALGAYAIVKTILSMLSSDKGVLYDAIRQVFGN